MNSEPVIGQADEIGAVEVSVIIPVYNCASTVPAVVDAVLAALAHMTFEFVLVDDGSSDNSWKAISQLAKYDEVRGLRMLKNYGQHAAVVAGLEAACGAWVVTIDDDGENDPADIPELLRVAREGGHDLVFAERRGRRVANWSSYRQPDCQWGGRQCTLSVG